MTESGLRFPLSKKALLEAFSTLNPESVTVDKQPGWHEACVNGAWSLTRLKAHIKALGFSPVGHRDQLLFVNEEKTVGFQLQGVAPHRNKNTWSTYSIEVQARPKSQAVAEAKQTSRAVMLWP